MACLVRSWNVFHGRPHPPQRYARLEQAVRLVTADDPDVVCLQEVPVWALSRLAGWSSMQVFSAVARRAPLGVRAGRVLTAAHHGLIRSAFTGQGNAILTAPGLEAQSLGAIRISAPGRERRICQAARVEGGLVVANLHASGGGAHVTAPEIGRALAWLDGLAAAGEALVLAGDFNVRPELPGFSPPGPGIDHILQRGARSGPLEIWPPERRVENGRLLSDHAPVELTIARRA